MATKEDKAKLAARGRINRREEITGGEPKEWWTNTSRRTFIVGGAAAAGVALAGGGLWLALRDDTTDVDKDSLELQQSDGWNVGSEEKPLTLPGARDVDSQDGQNWTRYADPSAMLSAYQPRSSAWQPYFVPTLIQSLQSETLRNQMKPIATPDMAEAYERARALSRDVFDNTENVGETAFVVDLPGRASVAFGAGVADRARVVTTFDNYPHPLGVTPSHETLAAMLNYAAETESKQESLPDNAPPVFLLDSQRLAPYKDADAQFDNRYVAKLPSAQKLQEAGIKSIVYVTPDRTRAEELDDLNEDFVDYKNRGLNVAMLPLGDLTASDERAGSWEEGQNNGGRTYHYGGNPAGLIWLFYAYPFFRPNAAYLGRNPGYAAAGRSVSAPITAPRYLPAARPTMFAGTRVGRAGAGAAAGAAVGRTKPSGFGRSTVRVSSAGGVVGTRAGRSGYYSPNRSGSFGRSGGSRVGG